MANAKKCDRCGKYYDGGNRKFHIYDRNPAFCNPLDLCEKCETELMQWFGDNLKLKSGVTDQKEIVND